MTMLKSFRVWWKCRTKGHTPLMTITEVKRYGTGYVAVKAHKVCTKCGKSLGSTYHADITSTSSSL